MHDTIVLADIFESKLHDKATDRVLAADTRRLIYA